MDAVKEEKKKKTDFATDFVSRLAYILTVIHKILGLMLCFTMDFVKFENFHETWKILLIIISLGISSDNQVT